jgi:tetratricopeptide (TPR) repeat protein
MANFSRRFRAALVVASLLAALCATHSRARAEVHDTPRPARVVPPLRIAVPRGSVAIVRTRPLAASLEIEFRPRAPASLHGLRAHPMVASARISSEKKKHRERLIIALREVRWPIARREADALSVSLREFPGPRPLDAASLVYPRWTPGAIAEVAAGSACPEVADVLARLRREPAAVHAQLLIGLVQRGGVCGDTARLAFGEAALRLRRAEVAVAVLLVAKRSQIRDRLLARAAHAAGDYALAAEAYDRVGKDALGGDLTRAAEMILAGGDPARAARWLREALARLPKDRRAAIQMRLADASMLAGQRDAAVSELRRIARAGGDLADEAQTRRLAFSTQAEAGLRFVAGDSAAPNELGIWYRGLRAFGLGDIEGVRAAVEELARRSPVAAVTRAARDLWVLRIVTSTRELERRGAATALALLLLRAGNTIFDEAHGAQLCRATLDALLGVGLTRVAERTSRRCLPVLRSAGFERDALLVIAAAQAARGKHAHALRTLRYVAARDPLGTAADARFWAQFGDALWRDGQFALALSALRRAEREGTPRVRTHARRSLGELLWDTGHRAFARGRLGLDAASPNPRAARDPSLELKAISSRVERGIRSLTARASRANPIDADPALSRDLHGSSGDGKISGGGGSKEARVR